MIRGVVIQYTPTFIKNYKKLPLGVRRKAEKRELIFRKDQFSPSLKTHKLSGNLSGYWSFLINYQYRIIFRFLESRDVLFVDAETHSVYK